ncbi:carbonic anhydrase [Coprinellus micaceus]|uniref:Carbonic anhydrase n=1 Tax=Coprinellus micaceus TaxID=71717 RepID=A0A4Y7SNZ9_COPMI|nr:carbonic anhydrase [Coprinellus micaceus]
MFKALPTSLFIFTVFSVFSSSTRAYSLPGALGIVARTETVNQSPGGDFDLLYQGNQAFRQEDPALLKDLALNGQHPPFLFLGCSDSRVSEGTVFDAKPGTLFTERNIANRYSFKDPNVRSALAYGLGELHTKHVIVMGHYGCGGVAASIATPPKLPWDEGTAVVQGWINPIRKLYHTTKRKEVVELRQKNRGKSEVPAPPLHDPGFRALVEENVKVSVKKLASDGIVREVRRD